jgi:hypothetical protein
MGRRSKVNEITIGAAVAMLMADPPNRAGAIKQHLADQYDVSLRTAANILSAAKEQLRSVKDAQGDGFLFPDAILPAPAAVNGTESVGNPEVQYNAIGPLPDAKEVRNMLKAANLNLINSISAYPKDIIAATRELSHLYKLDEPEVSGDELTPVEADQVLAKTLTDLLGMQGAFYLPEGDTEDE